MGRTAEYAVLTLLIGGLILFAGSWFASAMDESFRAAAANLEQMDRR